VQDARPTLLAALGFALGWTLVLPDETVVEEGVGELEVRRGKVSR
jgi:hypothetical protein